jgi:hypothetical protein
MIWDNFWIKENLQYFNRKIIGINLQEFNEKMYLIRIMYNLRQNYKTTTWWIKLTIKKTLMVILTFLVVFGYDTVN